MRPRFRLLLGATLLGLALVVGMLLPWPSVSLAAVQPCTEPVGSIGLPSLPADIDDRDRPRGAGCLAGVCVIERVVDGDTVICEDRVRVRLLLIDAPEVADGGLGLRATLALEEMLPVGSATLAAVDVERRDRYGRLLAHLYDGEGRWINRALVRAGYAVPLVYPPNVDGISAIRAAADSARSEGAGLWAEDGFTCLPVDFRAGRCDGES